jgi:hypothetical protein
MYLMKNVEIRKLGLKTKKNLDKKLTGLDKGI